LVNVSDFTIWLHSHHLSPHLSNALLTTIRSAPGHVGAQVRLAMGSLTWSLSD
jgi:hypothetical protein